MKLTQEDFDQMVEEAKPAIMAAFKDEVTKSISWEMRNKAIELIRADIEAWVKKEILPEVADHLAASKDGILSVAKKATDEISGELAKSMCETLTEKLSNSWSKRAVFEALFSK